MANSISKQSSIPKAIPLQARVPVLEDSFFSQKDEKNRTKIVKGRYVFADYPLRDLSKSKDQFDHKATLIKTLQFHFQNKVTDAEQPIQWDKEIKVMNFSDCSTLIVECMIVLDNQDKKDISSNSGLMNERSLNYLRNRNFPNQPLASVKNSEFDSKMKADPDLNKLLNYAKNKGIAVNYSKGNPVISISLKNYILQSPERYLKFYIMMNKKPPLFEHEMDAFQKKNRLTLRFNDSVQCIKTLGNVLKVQKIMGILSSSPHQQDIPHCEFQEEELNFVTCKPCNFTKKLDSYSMKIKNLVEYFKDWGMTIKPVEGDPNGAIDVDFSTYLDKHIPTVGPISTSLSTFPLPSTSSNHTVAFSPCSDSESSSRKQDFSSTASTPISMRNVSPIPMYVPGPAFDFYSIYKSPKNVDDASKEPLAPSSAPGTSNVEEEFLQYLESQKIIVKLPSLSPAPAIPNPNVDSSVQRLETRCSKNAQASSELSSPLSSAPPMTDFHRTTSKFQSSEEYEDVLPLSSFGFDSSILDNSIMSDWNSEELGATLQSSPKGFNENKHFQESKPVDLGQTRQKRQCDDDEEQAPSKIMKSN